MSRSAFVPVEEADWRLTKVWHALERLDAARDRLAIRDSVTRRKDVAWFREVLRNEMRDFAAWAAEENVPNAGRRLADLLDIPQRLRPLIREWGGWVNCSKCGGYPDDGKCSGCRGRGRWKRTWGDG